MNDIQILRGIAFLAIVLQHVIGHTGYLPNLGIRGVTALTILLGLVKFAVPMFVFITGFVLIYNYYDKLNYKRFIFNRFKDIFIPYVIWTVFYYFWLRWEHLVPKDNFKEGLNTIYSSVISGEGLYHLWYMVLILQFYILFPLFRKGFLWVKKHKIDGSTCIFTAFVIFLGLLKLHNNYIPVLFQNYKHNVFTDFFITYRNRTFIYWSFYFILGGYFALNLENLKEKLKSYKILFTAAFFGFLAYGVFMVISQAVKTPLGYQVNYEIVSPLAFSMTGLSISAIYMGFTYTDSLSLKFKSIAKLFTFIGNYSFGSYLIHPLFIYYAFNVYIIKYTTNPYLETILGFIFVAVLSTASSFVLNKIPLVNRLILGTKSKRKSIKNPAV